MTSSKTATTRPRRPAPLEHVVVATDFSPGAERALGRAARLPLAEGGSLTVVHVLPERVSPQARASVDKAARRQLGLAVKTLSKSLATLGRRDLQVTSELLLGQAYVEVIRCARAMGADLVVLGRHGQRPIRDMFIGSTASRVVRLGDVPVLVVSARAIRNYGKPLIAVALEDTCRGVVTTALQVLGPDVDAATMLHVYHVPFEGLTSPGLSAGQKTALRDEYAKSAASAVAKLQASVGDLGVEWKTTLLRGDPRVEILAERKRSKSDLLAVGTHGRSGLSHALLGSVADWVIQAAQCDVLVARPARVSFGLP